MPYVDLTAEELRQRSLIRDMFFRDDPKREAVDPNEEMIKADIAYDWSDDPEPATPRQEVKQSPLTIVAEPHSHLLGFGFGGGNE